MRERVLVLKLNPQGEEMWRYEGDVIERGEDWLKVEALFDRDDRPFMDTTLKRGDRFVETYYSARWYNIFEIYDRDDGALKGWYCNITRPATWTDGRIEYVDLFLDLWVGADGTQTVLDEDEFSAASLDDDLRRAARAGLAEVQARFRNQKSPD
jgi:protein associated with RNAse G/E